MRIYRWIVGICLVCLAIMIPVGVVFYGAYVKHWEGPGFRRIVHVIPLPAARVGSTWITYDTYLHHLDAERELFHSPTGQADGMPKLTDLELHQDALERLIRITAIEQFAKQRDIVITPLDVDRAFDGLRLQNGTSTTVQEFQGVIKDRFGWTQDEYKTYFLAPAMLEDGLNKKSEAETNASSTFPQELDARISQPDVVRYIKFS